MLVDCACQETVTEAVIEKLESWRPRFVTRWNRYCSAALETFLSLLEDAAAVKGPVPDINTHLAEVSPTP